MAPGHRQEEGEPAGDEYSPPGATGPLQEVDPQILDLPNVPYYELFRYPADTHERQVFVAPQFADATRNGTATPPLSFVELFLPEKDFEIMTENSNNYANSRGTWKWD